MKIVGPKRIKIMKEQTRRLKLTGDRRPQWAKTVEDGSKMFKTKQTGVTQMPKNKITFPRSESKAGQEQTLNYQFRR